MSESPAPELASTLVNSEDDRLLQAESLVRSVCGWHIAPERVETFVLDGAGAATLMLPTMHLLEVLQVEERGKTLGEWREVLPEEYEWSEAGMLTAGDGYLNGWWTDRQRGVRVTIRHGYDKPPAEVVAVVRAIAQRGVDNPRSLVRRQAGPFSDTYSQTGANQALPIAILDAEERVLERYRIRVRP